MSTQLSVMDSRYGFTPEQVDVIKATIAPGATNEELALFLMVCQKKGLDPFSRQIYLSERRSFDTDTQQWVVKKSPETTIDGFRCIAERSGKYEGQLGPFWCGEDGAWKDVWLGKTMPSAAKVGILRKDFKEPVWGIALFEEYVQTKKDGTPNKMWQKMGANQLAKCAESLALRKAFPADLSGMYTREEMAQSTKDEDDKNNENSKQAQQDVAQRRIKELNSFVVNKIEPITESRMAELQAEGKAQAREDFKHLSPATIIELADSLEQPPEVKKPPASTYEQREAAKKQEAAEALKVEKPARAKGDISFKALKEIGTLKTVIRGITNNDDKYYQLLEVFGVKHADELSLADGRKFYKALLQIPNALKQDEALLLEVQTHALRIGPYATEAILGRRGLKSIEEVLQVPNGDDLDALLTELRTTA